MSYSVQLVVSDGELNSEPVTETVTVTPGLPLEIESIEPVSASMFAVENIEIVIQLNQPAITYLNEAPYVADEFDRITVPVVLTEGANTFALEFDNFLGQTLEETLTYYLDTIAPPKPDASAVSVYVVNNELTVTGAPGSVESGTVITLTNRNSEATVTAIAQADGSFSAVVVANAQDQIEIVSSDAVLNLSEALVISGSTVDPDSAAVLSGMVFNYGEETVAGAVISAINQSTGQVDVQTLSQPDATYQLELNANTPYVLQINAAGYVDQIINIESSPVDESQVQNLFLLPRDASVAFNEDEGATIQGAQGSSVSVAANHFDAATGTAAMQVAITSLDLTQPGVEYALPGMRSGSTDQGDTYSLAFMGVVEVEFSDAQGSEVDLLADKTAQVVIPVVINGLDESSVEWRVGDSVPVWTLNEATGEWRQSGMAEVVANEQSPTGLAVVTQVSSFSFHAVGVQLFDNTQPTAVISGDLNVTVGDEITLDAAASTDAEDDLLSYQWSFVARPQGSDAVIADKRLKGSRLDKVYMICNYREMVSESGVTKTISRLTARLAQESDLNRHYNVICQDLTP